MKSSTFIVLLIVVILVFTGGAIFRTAAMTNETMTISDVYGDRGKLAGVEISCVLTDLIHNIEYTLTDGMVEEKRFSIYDKGIDNPILSDTLAMSNIKIGGKDVAITYLFGIASDSSVTFLSYSDEKGNESFGAMAGKAQLLIEFITLKPTAGPDEFEQVSQVLETGVFVNASLGGYFYFSCDGDPEVRGNYRFNYEAAPSLDTKFIDENEELLDVLVGLHSGSFAVTGGNTAFFVPASSPRFSGISALYHLDATPENMTIKRVATLSVTDDGQPLYVTKVGEFIYIALSMQVDGKDELLIREYDGKAKLTQVFFTGIRGVAADAEVAGFSEPGGFNLGIASQSNQFVFVGIEKSNSEPGRDIKARAIQSGGTLLSDIKLIKRLNADTFLCIFADMITTEQAGESIYELYGIFISVLGAQGEMLYLGELKNDALEDYQQSYSPTESGGTFSEFLGQANFFRDIINFTVGNTYD